MLICNSIGRILIGIAAVFLIPATLSLTGNAARVLSISTVLEREMDQSPLSGYWQAKHDIQ